MTEEDKVLYGGPLTFDISKDVGSLGEYVLKILREKDGHKIVLVSELLLYLLQDRLN